MTEKQATKRYFKIFIPAMLIYILGIIVAVWARGNLINADSIYNYWVEMDMLGLARGIFYFLSIVPIFAIFGMAWAQWRYIGELDEYLRMVQIKGLLFGLVCILAVATVWGLLEMLVHVPDLPLYWLMPIFWISYSVSVGFFKGRNGSLNLEE